MSEPLKLVLDTNVVISALLWRGRPLELLDHAAIGSIRLATSEGLLNELRRSLAKPRLAARLLATGITVDEHAANYAIIAETVEAPPLSNQVSRDPDDDSVLACALAAQANAIATGDDDLLTLGAWEGIAILRVTECLEVVAALQDR